jgi:hypothetical protein
MLIEIVKRADGASLLRCTRDDQSIIWQKIPRHGAHFALHDITHYVVETTLGLRGAFFGLLNQGWEFEDTTGKGDRGPVPPEAGVAESIVGLFDAERASGTLWTREEFEEFGNDATRKQLRDEQIGTIRKRRSELFQQWAAIPVGQALELHF